MNGVVQLPSGRGTRPTWEATIEIETVIFWEPGRHPGQIQPAGPALAEIAIIIGAMRGRRHGTGPVSICLPGSAIGRAANSAAVLPGCSRILVEIPPPQSRPKADKMSSTTNEKRQENQVFDTASPALGVWK